MTTIAQHTDPSRGPHAAARKAPALLLMLAFICLATFLGIYCSALGETGSVTVDAGELAPLAAVFVVLPAAVITAGLAAGLRRFVRSSTSTAQPRGRLRAGLDRVMGALDRALFSWRVRSVILLALLLAASWSFWVVAFCPGSMIYDTYYQITQVYPRFSENHIPVWSVPGRLTFTQYSDHHPIFDTLLYGLFATVSENLTGNWNAGIFTFSCLQAILTAAAFAVSLCRLRRMGAPRALVLGAFLFVLLVPVVGANAGVVIKDMLFSALFAGWFTMAVETVFTRGAALGSRGFLAVNIALALLLALTRKTGIYVVVPTMVVYAVLYRRFWWRALLPAVVSAAVLWGVLPGVVFPVLDVAPGGSQEILGVLYQQTARYVSLHGVEVGSRERAAIDAVLDYDTLAERYEPDWADPVKYGAETDPTAEEVSAYLEVWLAQGLRHPEVYLDATFSQLTGFFSPAWTIQLRDETWDVDNDGTRLLRQPWQLEDMRETAREVWETLSEAPVIGLLLTCPPYVLWIPLFCLWAMLVWARRSLPIMVPVLLCLCLVLVSPMYDARYALPLIYAAPLLVLGLAAGMARDARSAEAPVSAPGRL